MSPSEEADRRIAALEIKLAKIQSEETTPLQIEANLRRQTLAATLTTAATIASAALGILGRAADDFERAHDDMADGLNGRAR